MAEKIHSTVFFTFFVSESAPPRPKHVKASRSARLFIKINHHRPPLSNIKGTEALATWNVLTRHFQWAEKRGWGRGFSKCIKHPNLIKKKIIIIIIQITFLNPFGHSYCLSKRLGRKTTGVWTEPAMRSCFFFFFYETPLYFHRQAPTVCDRRTTCGRKGERRE